MKLKLPDVTLCIVDCVDAARAQRSLDYNKSLVKFSASKLLTSLESNHPNKQTINPLTSIEQYSHFMVKELANYFKSSHVLVVQHDGFILNPNKWQHSFLRYDYIGAPWPDELLLSLGYGTEYNVGNGGFSLRSLKLQKALRDDPNIVSTHRAEDNTICIEYREYLEKTYNIKFAPAEVAKIFSKENHQGNTFGQHGQYRI